MADVVGRGGGFVCGAVLFCFALLYPGRSREVEAILWILDFGFTQNKPGKGGLLLFVPLFVGILAFRRFVGRFEFRMFECSNVRMFECSNVRMFECSNVRKSLQ